MPCDIRFDGRVAIVTGAGRGLGREYALGLARRGARVVVNDLGVERNGQGRSAEAAERVAKEIEDLGGEALAHGASVTDAAAVEDMVAKAMQRWGRVDILVANAGVLRDRSFLKMELDDFRFVLETHLMGAATCIKAVWPIMHERNYGRIAVATSSSGLYGNFGQANYGAAKMGLVGLMQTLKLEGQKHDIRVNAICPIANTRMTAEVYPAAQLEKLPPSAVTPGLLYLVSRDAPTGAILSAGGGVFGLIRIEEAQGANLGLDATPEQVRDAWQLIGDRTGEIEPKAGIEQTHKIMAELAA
jgi:NAD(P)-dependent dehydrogenase (short-subunit alcohol dehydrogenase family)